MPSKFTRRHTFTTHSPTMSIVAPILVAIGFPVAFGAHTLLQADQVKNKFFKDMRPQEIASAKNLAMAATLGPLALMYARYRPAASGAKSLTLLTLGTGLKTVGVFGLAQSVISPNPQLEAYMNGAANSKSFMSNQQQAEGMVRITRHPISWSVAAFALGNVLTRFTVADAVYWGGMGAFSVYHAYTEDKNNRAILGESFYKNTSFVPFEAILKDKQKMVDLKKEINQRAIGITTLAAPLLLL
ncbi:hypothetical protein SeMB42_g07828 [Synchytrium endobioticum]|uniref:NnrU domain-containing protein n=1 Tax=Synchytrium endobioticum TaxID=286115 RepID=A0A507CQK3_9FUNG|nr:hypothetical protein SeMB42_g07828 [Synchytrium endobioticum]TPX41409.1 hypothetical protein SeLEV6574_g06105 [Synchytrium endobioticum]